MTDELVQQNTLRDTLETNFEAAEAGTLPTPEERARDEIGRFAKKEIEVAAEVPVEKPAPQRPTTWKKDYLPIWDKIAAGNVAELTSDEAKKLAEYTQQRETEYKTGVSTYKSEAQNAREMIDAISPHAQDLQAHGMTPAQWIKDMGQVHNILSRGAPEQKLWLFQELARRYGVPLAAIQAHQPGQQVPPILSQIMQPIGDMRSQIQALYAWKQQSEQDALNKEVSQMEGEVNRFAADAKKYPHFEAVREPMAQLLEAGVARDLPTAYKMAVRNDDDLHQQELNQVLQQQQLSKSGVVAKARANAVSPRSATPSGQVTASGAKDRRTLLSEAFDAHGGGRV